MVQARNLWQLLQMTRDRSALMRACGISESVLTDGSDYDRFDAYAACMPLCHGHEILQADAQLVEELLGVRVPICPESAPICGTLRHMRCADRVSSPTLPSLVKLYAPPPRRKRFAP